MKLKIISPEFSHYTGHFGTVLFQDGVSVGDVSSAEARVIAAITTVVDAETGARVGDVELWSTSQTKTAEVYNYPTVAQRKAMQASSGAPAPQTAVAAVVAAAASVAAVVHTVESLSAVADAKGIKGLREIGDTFGVKANTTAKLIDAILAAQNKANVKPPVLDPVVTQDEPAATPPQQTEQTESSEQEDEQGDTTEEQGGDADGAGESEDDITTVVDDEV